MLVKLVKDTINDRWFINGEVLKYTSISTGERTIARLNQYIFAIKGIREYINCGLKDAKDLFVEANLNGEAQRDLQPTSAPIPPTPISTQPIVTPDRASILLPLGLAELDEILRSNLQGPLRVRLEMAKERLK